IRAKVILHIDRGHKLVIGTLGNRIVACGTTDSTGPGAERIVGKVLYNLPYLVADTRSRATMRLLADRAVTGPEVNPELFRYIDGRGGKRRSIGLILFAEYLLSNRCTFWNNASRWHQRPERGEVKTQVDPAF